MADITKDQLLGAVIRGLPYSEQISKVDTGSEASAIRIGWRGHLLRISTNLNVEEVEGQSLYSNDLAMLAERLIQKAFYENIASESKVQQKVS